jgi:hypothetical protein
MAPTTAWGKFWAESLRHFVVRGEKEAGKNWGDEWGEPMTNFCRPVLEKWVLPFMKERGKKAVVLEIGPGGGRLTQFLTKCKKLYLVEYNAEFFTQLRERFNDPKHFVYVHTKLGRNFPRVPKNRVDFVFSWGTFVHFEIDHIADYLKALVPVMKKRAQAVIQFPDTSRPEHQGAFGNVTEAQFVEAAEKAGFQVVSVDSESLPNSSVALLVKS